MRVTFYARAGFESDPLFLYIHSHVASRWPENQIVAYRPAPQTLKARARKMKRLGFTNTLEIMFWAPLATYFRRKDRARIASLLSALPRPDVKLSASPVSYVSTINGDDAVQAVKKTKPDVLLQAGAGILKKQIISIPRLATLNMHHGIAPLIKGMSSIYWALLERRPEWIGATVHEVDEGIDTGQPLGYAPVTRLPGEGFPELFVKATADGVKVMVDVLASLERGEKKSPPIPDGPRVYRSTMSGWKMLKARLST
jgi:folate-dependent phosphoribosylglycinamide formyltransferase PurN